MSDYKPWDREEKLGPPPWTDKEAVAAWEAAHGHDVRLRCDSWFGGCQLMAARAEKIEDLARAACEAEFTSERLAAMQRLREALDD